MKFRSKGEERIADFFEKKNIKYLYEFPLAVLDDGKLKIWYPDFNLPEYGIILEYLGMSNNKSYENTTKHKKKVYSLNQLEVLFLDYKHLENPNWDEILLNKIGNIVATRFGRFQEFFRR